MRITLILLTFVAVLMMPARPVAAGDVMLETFENRPQDRWRFFSDTVMGGVSEGQVAFLEEDGASFARMTGRVSTANNGGFIQMRLDLPSPPADGTTGLRLSLRGNDQRYFVHVRTRGTRLPWQYYQAGFDVTGKWTEVRLPFASFAASGNIMRQVPRTTSITSIGIVAFGRDHDAQIDVREIGFY